MTAPVATTRRLDTPPDLPALLAVAGVAGAQVWRSPSLVLAGVGVGARIDLPAGLADAASVRAANTALGAIGVDDDVQRPGTGPVALGALPFDPAVAGSLVVPRTLWGLDADGAWVTVMGPPGTEADPLPPDGGDPAPDSFSMTPSMPHRQWAGLISEAVARIAAGALDKVVLARRIDVEANRPFPVPEVLARLVALYPTCMCFALDGFLGASPELLVRRRGRRVESLPLAGTVARSGDPVADDALVARLMASPKERSEHGFVIDALTAGLAPLCAELEVPDAPTVIGLRNVSHLATAVRATLANRDGVATALDLVAALHPTPAVGGVPTKEAVAHIQAVEGFDRGRYAGPVGWYGATGDGDVALGIRSATVDGARASMYAGVGVVAGSDPAAELAETQLKLQALLAALVRP